MILLAAFVLDLCLGDPRWLPHPIRGFGRLAAWLEPVWRKVGGRAAGIGFAVSAIGAAVAFVWVTCRASAAIAVYWTYSMLALRDLDVEAGAVVRELRHGDLGAARSELANVVGRDTQDLDEPEILRAVLETVAENLSDAVIAPLFYYGLAGPTGMAAYKAVNTLDSMVGYKNERYREFGWASARFDDVLNYVPARISAALIWVVAGLLGFDLRRSVKTVWRDAGKQPSPNAGYPEAAMAGALGLRLGGMNVYGGVAQVKPWLGDPVRPLSMASFGDARKILYSASTLMVLLVLYASAWR